MSEKQAGNHGRAAYHHESAPRHHRAAQELVEHHGMHPTPAGTGDADREKA